MSYLITLLCILIALVILAGAFYLAKYVLNAQLRKDVLEENYKLAMEHIQKQEDQIIYLTQEVDHMQHEAKLGGERVDRKRSWEPSNLLNSEPRQ